MKVLTRNKVIVLIKGTAYKIAYDLEKLGFKFGRREKAFVKVVHKDQENLGDLLKDIKKKAEGVAKIDIYIIETPAPSGDAKKIETAKEPCPNCPTGRIRHLKSEKKEDKVVVIGVCLNCGKTVEMNSKWLTHQELSKLETVSNLIIEFER